MRAFFNGPGRAVPRVHCPSGTLLARTQLVCFLLLLFAGSTLAQSPAWTSPDYLHFRTLPDSGHLAPGATFDLVLDLGSEALPADAVLGIDVEVTIAGAEPAQTPPLVDPANSWLWTAGDAPSATWDEGELRLDGVRDDSTGQTGQGEILRIPMEVSGDTLDLQQLQLDGGGLVLVDNVDLKRPRSTAALVQHLKVWPNPAHESAHVSARPAGEWQLVLMNDGGQTVRRQRTRRPGDATFDLQGLPTGVYRVVATNEHGTSTMMQSLFVR